MDTTVMPISDIEAAKLYSEYRNSMTPDDEELYTKIMEYEELFDDMCFMPNSIIHDFTTYSIEDDEGGFEEVTNEYYFELSNQKWRVYVDTISEEGTLGFSNDFERKIVIDHKHKDDKSVILHEMIHAHEAILNRLLSSYYCEILLICLYKKLKDKIPDLYDRIVNFANVEIGSYISLKGGEHGILFLLKSFDLDLRCGYKLGTVCGYKQDQFE